MMVMAFQSSPIFSLPRARLEYSEVIFRFMRSLVCACFLSWTGPARSDRSRPGQGISKPLGELRNVGIVFQKQHDVDVKDFGNLLAPRRGHGRRGEIVDRRYQVDRLGGMLPTGRIAISCGVFRDALRRSKPTCSYSARLRKMN